MQWLRQFFHHDPRRIPLPLWRSCVAPLRPLARLGAPDLARLKSLAEHLLDTKTFSGAGGFVVTDEIAVQVAAQAVLPILNLTLRLYDDMTGIIVYPAAFLVSESEVDEAGVVHEWRAPLSGEAIAAGGAVVLSSEDLDALDGNVIIHEFAHKIDMADGDANGCPPFLTEFHGKIDRNRWKTAFTDAYEDLQRHLAKSTHGRLPLDPYAARNPAEFFAVASETFFVDPQLLASGYTEVYGLLRLYYRQDPLSAR